MLTTDKKARKERPITSGFLDYFPHAIAEVANVSYVGNQQHNPGQPLHWDKSKSTDHADCVARHLIDRGKFDDDGLRHSGKMAWRALALLETEITDDQERANEYYESIQPQKYAGDFRTIPLDEIPQMDVHEMVFTENDRDSSTCSEPQCSLDSVCDKHMGKHAKFTPEPERTLPSIPQGDIFNRARMRLRLHNLNCSGAVSRQIAGGASFVKGSQYVYIAGPMRGHPEFNFPAFDAARDEFLQNGWNVISPADIDRADKIDATEHPTGDASEFDQRVFVYRDFYALFLLAHLQDGAIAMLPGWEKSTGAVSEFFLARWLNLRILNARTGQGLDPYGVDFHALRHSIIRYLQGQK